jgi:primosomal protein N' (replication factor Y) (superfamily II helicase)
MCLNNLKGTKMSKIASVVISNSTRDFDKEYYYCIPAEILDLIKPGMRVIVPFGKSNRSLEAYVVNVLENENTNELKEIKKLIDVKPVITEELLGLSKWMKNRYICTYSDAIKCMLPPGIGVKSYCIVKLEKNVVQKNKNAQMLLDALIDVGGECELNILKKRVNIKTFNKLIKVLHEEESISTYEKYSVAVKEKTIRVAYIIRPYEEIIEEIESGRIKRIQHLRILEMLMENEYIAVQDIIRFAGVSKSALDTLKRQQLIDFKEIEVKRDPMQNKVISRTEPLKPTPEQAVVLEKLKGKLSEGEFDEVLLHGVTGSGKTEIYLQLIQFCIEKGKEAIVLVPEISLTPQMVDRFKSRFGQDVAILHSRLSLGERYDQWRLIREGRAKVAVGARSAVFAPFEHLGLIVIDEEHESTYKSEITPKYHARDIARKRCSNVGAVLMGGSATPSVESYYNAENGRISLAELTERTNRMVMPGVEIVDLRDELNNGNRTMFSSRLTEEIRKNIESGQQTILFLNRRGHSSFVLCRSCGHTIKCLNCNISLTYHSHDDRLICHYCGYTIKSPNSCPKCKSTFIRHFGMGTQKVEEEIKRVFPGCSVIRMDMDTTSYKNSHEEILRAFREENINIMVGTQMIAKGHDFPNVTLVGVLAADSLLNIQDYKASERTFQLITQVAGRAGRGELAGRAIIQTYNTESFCITTASKHNYKDFYRQEIMLREKLDYPPFTNIANIILSGINDKAVFVISRKIKSLLASSFITTGCSVDILGPTRAPLSKIKNKFRWRIVIKCKDEDTIISVLSDLSDKFYKKNKGAIRLSIDINPVNML